ncbi:TSP-17 protein [Aphelenchoides avenae]|nr:TSP-17 protein [Aphelenchus avenae]
MTSYGGGSCLRSLLLIFVVLFWINGFVLIAYGLWMLLDPARTYVLDIVDFSEDDPLLRFSTYTCLTAGALAVLAGIVGCVGAVKAERCFLSAFTAAAVLLFLSGLAICLLSMSFRERFHGNQMLPYLKNMTHNRYSRDKWVTPLLDTVQFYQQCCGGEGPKDYLNSFWYITNTERGTRSFVPRSCCRQSQNGRAWSLVPVDPMCTTYGYYTRAFNDSVHMQGCHERMQNYLEEQTASFFLLGIVTCVSNIFGALITLFFLRQVSSRYYIVA